MFSRRSEPTVQPDSSDPPRSTAVIFRLGERSERPCSGEWDGRVERRCLLP